MVICTENKESYYHTITGELKIYMWLTSKFLEDISNREEYLCDFGSKKKFLKLLIEEENIDKFNCNKIEKLLVIKRHCKEKTSHKLEGGI